MKKKVITMLVCGAMALSLAACGSSSTTEKEDTEEEKTEATSDKEDAEVKEVAEEEDDTVEIETTGLVTCFKELAENIAVMTYDEAVEYMDNSGFAFDAVAPSYSELGTITSEDDEDGCHLWLAVYLDDDYNYTIYDVSYGNGHFEGSVSDNTHVTDPVYETFNTYADPPRTEVGSLEDVIAYITNEMPTLIREEIESPAGEPIDVTMSVSDQTTGEGTTFTIETNLPDGMTLMLTLSGNDFTAQTHATVKDGVAVSDAFSNKGAALHGDYELKVTSGLATTQSDDVQSIIGIDGENLTGEYVETDDSGKSMVTATFNFTF